MIDFALVEACLGRELSADETIRADVIATHLEAMVGERFPFVSDPFPATVAGIIARKVAGVIRAAVLQAATPDGVKSTTLGAFSETFVDPFDLEAMGSAGWDFTASEWSAIARAFGATTGTATFTGLVDEP